MLDRASLAQRISRFAHEAEAHASPLYQRLAPVCAASETVLDLIAAHTQAGQPPANMIFAAVHALLMGLPAEPLRVYYRSLGGDAAPDANADALFLQFIGAHRTRIAALLETRMVQTNEVRRCSYIAQACAHISRECAGQPLTLIEVGTSAGLNLIWDRYAYRYAHADGSSTRLGDPNSAVLIETQWRGGALLDTAPSIAARIGLDLKIIDARNDDDRRWLRALVWPEHTDRLALLDSALAMAAHTPLTLIEGSAAETLAQALAQAPTSSVPVVCHTHVLNQFDDRQRAKLYEHIHKAAQERPVYHFGNDMLPSDGHSFPLISQRWENHRVETRHLANVHGHGRWVEWLR